MYRSYEAKGSSIISDTVSRDASDVLDNSPETIILYLMTTMYTRGTKVNKY